MLAELNSASEDAALVVEMVEKLKPTTNPPVQAVAPRPNPNVTPAPQPASPRPAPAPAPAPAADGSSEEVPVEVLDSEDELVQDMSLTPRRERRLRRQLQTWRDRSSSSD